jgi:hypothetical protein
MIKNCRLLENSEKNVRIHQKNRYFTEVFFRSAPDKFKFTSRKGPVHEYFVKMHALAVFKNVLEYS